MIEILFTSPHASLYDSAGSRQFFSRPDRRRDGCSRRRHHLPLLIRQPQCKAVSRCYISRSRHRYRYHSVLTPDLAMSLRQRRYHYVLHSQVVEADCHTDDIDDRINRPNLMEMDFIDGKAMRFRFRLRHNKKHVPGQFLYFFLGIQAFNNPVNIRKIPVDV